MNEIMNVEKHALVGMEFNEQQVDLIKKTVAKGTTNDELALFLYTCKKTGLDPLIKQIYAVKRNTKSGAVMAIQTGIDGYRLIAERTGKYAPGKEPSFKEENGKLIAATAYVNKLVGGTWHEVAATARFSEYVNATNPIWIKMPFAMLSKCAESLVLRKAFPAEMGGVYTQEEMEQADVKPLPALHKSAPLPAEQVEDAVVVDDLKAKAESAKAKIQALEAEERAKKATEQPQEAPKADNKANAPTDDENTATGIISRIVEPTGKSRHVKFPLEGYDRMFFSTDNPLTIDRLRSAYTQGQRVKYKYTVTEWAGGLNHNIIEAEIVAGKKDIMEEPAF